VKHYFRRFVAIFALAAAVGLMPIVGLDRNGGEAQARSYSDAVKVACSADYKRYCSRYSPNSKKDAGRLRSCMRANGKRLSDVCIRALVDAGEVSRSALRRRR